MLTDGRWAVVYASLGHFLFHYVTAMYFSLVLGLARDWGEAYEALLRLWVPGAIAIGVLSLPMGWIKDIWASAHLMCVMFFGLALGCVVAGLSGDGLSLTLALVLIGSAGAIYHPVGIPWVIEAAGEGSKGRFLALNGIFGTLGSAGAGAVSGYVMAMLSWRWGFFVPGAACALAGVGLVYRIMTGSVLLGRGHHTLSWPRLRWPRMEIPLGVMLIAGPIIVGGTIYHSLQVSMPQMFTERVIADPVRALALVGVVWLDGVWLLLGCLIVSLCNTAVLPAENLLLSGYVPRRHQGMVFGAKFVLSFGIGPVIVELIAWSRAYTGAFTLHYQGVLLLAVVAVLLALVLPHRAMGGER